MKAKDNPWEVLEYEALMYFKTRIRFRVVSPAHLGNRSITVEVNPPITVITNALVESRILHTRQIVDILLSKGSEDDDIRLKDLLPNTELQREFKSLIDDLKVIYGSRKQENSPCWIFNKMLAHPTKHRTTEYNYGQTLDKLDPIISKILELLSVRTRRPSLFPFHPKQSG